MRSMPVGYGGSALICLLAEAFNDGRYPSLIQDMQLQVGIVMGGQRSGKASCCYAV